MMIDDIAEGGSHEVDAIGYMGVINDYQCTGIVQVLSGEYNATGALSDTYAVDHMSAPALMNFGGGEYAGISAVDAAVGDDPRYPDQAISASSSSSGGFGSRSYNAAEYIVEAEGIYVGYQYYETRYYDSIADDKLAKNVTSAKGSTTGEAWNYDDEIVYTFGHGLSYLDYDQEITAIEVDNTNEGNITATVKITNKSDKDGLKGTAEMGLVCGPKHIGFNDQEHNRSGVSVYMNEQKFRQTDLRGFEGGLNEGGGLAVMVAFNRIGATNASHHVGMLKNILRGEWGFTGVISTDLASAPFLMRLL